ncbi:MAG: hypothetical protein Crog4KO_34910 [Crocinitomicaceae bacterium]
MKLASMRTLILANKTIRMRKLAAKREGLPPSALVRIDDPAVARNKTRQTKVSMTAIIPTIPDSSN